MAKADQNVTAAHFDGGNYYDDMRIDIAESHRSFAHLQRKTQSIHQPLFLNLPKLYLTGISIRLGLHEFFTVNGFNRKWFQAFNRYWGEILNGRPLWNTLDFFMLLHEYRKRQQYTTQQQWDGPQQHLANWQEPSQLYATLHLARRLATQPIVGLKLWNKVSHGMRILEYGCSLAPYYYCYREFFSHLDCRWVLADIPNFPFHYAKYLYRNDAEAEFVTINSEDFSNPLGEAGNFDLIILITVLEHLDDPLFVTEYLLNRLKPGGLFVFDYIKSEGTGLDHPKSVEQRLDCLKIILEKTTMIHGKITDLDQTIPLTIVQKKNS